MTSYSLVEKYRILAVWHFQYLPPANEVWGKVIFSEACVKNSVHGGAVCAGGRAWLGVGCACPGEGVGMHGGVVCMVGCVCLGACMAGGVHGQGCACPRGACMAGKACLAGEHACLGACVSGGMCGWSACMPRRACMVGGWGVDHVWWGMSRGHAWQWELGVVHGEGMHGRGACMVWACTAGGCVPCMHPWPDTTRYCQSMSRRYASYWNAFLLIIKLKQLCWVLVPNIEILLL